ncbi:MAG: SPOR domain-containing protein [Magnetococcales bacterium]|nr:SPOR domain-containing protein [Magnetococcales bacterium]
MSPLSDIFNKFSRKQTPVRAAQDGQEAPSQPAPLAVETASTSGVKGSTLIIFGLTATLIVVAGPEALDKWFPKKKAITVPTILPAAALLSDAADLEAQSGPPGMQAGLGMNYRDRMPTLTNIHRDGGGDIGLITTVSEPVGAGLLVDDQFLGTTPLQFEWPTGKYRMVLKKAGFYDLEVPLDVARGTSLDFNLALFPLGSGGGPAHGQGQAREKDGGGRSEAMIAQNSSQAPAYNNRAESFSSRQQDYRQEGRYQQEAPRYQQEAPRYQQEAREDRSRQSASQVADFRTPAPEPQQLKQAQESAARKNSLADASRLIAEQARATSVSKPEKSPAPEVKAQVQPQESTKDTPKKSREATESGERIYSMQVAAFQTIDAALKTANELQSKGYKPYILEVIDAKKRSWRTVQVGAFSSEPTARQALDAFIKRENRQAQLFGTSTDKFKRFLTRFEKSLEQEKTQLAANLVLPDPAPSDNDSASASTQAANTVQAQVQASQAQAQVSQAPQAEAAVEKVSASARQGSHAIQVGAYRAQAGAARVVRQLQEKGYDAYINEVIRPQNPDIVWQNVRIGHFKNIEEARSAAREFKRSEGTGAHIVTLDPTQEMQSTAAPMVTAQATTRTKPATISDVAEKAAASGSASTTASEKVNESPLLATASQENDSWNGESSQQADTLNAALAATSESVNERELSRISRSPVVLSGPLLEKRVTDLMAQAVEASAQGNNTEAEEGYRQVLELEPQHPEARRGLAQLLVATNRPAEALAILENEIKGQEYTKLAVSEPNLAAFLAALYQREEKHWQAIDLYEALLEQHPDKGIWRMGMAISLERVSENDEARKAYSLALNSGQLNRKLRSFVRKRMESM